MTETASALPPAFHRLAWSSLAAQTAEQIALAASPLVAVLVLGAAERETGFLQTALTLPYLLFALPFGYMVDRMRCRTVMALAEALRAMALLAILLLLSTPFMSMFWLASLGFLAACGTVAYSVAAPALVPSLVPQAQLTKANARMELARTMAFIGGPALGGLMVSYTGAGLAFAVAAALSAYAALALIRVAEEGRPAPPARDPLREVMEGAVFVVRHPLLRPILLTQVIFTIANFMTLAVLVPYAVRHLGLDAAGVGFLFTVFGVGLVTGALVASRVLRLLPFGIVIGIGPICGFLSSVLIALSIPFPSPLLAGLGMFLIGVGPILWTISTITLRQSVTPAELLGRVSALNVLAQGTRVFGALLGALIGGLYGAETCLVLAVAGFLAQMLAVWLSPVVRLTRQPVS